MKPSIPVRGLVIALVAPLLVGLLTKAVQADDAAPAAPTLDQATEAILNAPVAEVWKVFSTPEGFKKLGVAKCEMDFRVGGMIRAHYSPDGVLGDEGTIQNQIIAYEPERMIAFRIQQPPRGFPFAEETWKHTWSVATLSDLGDGRTHLRLVGLGYPDTEEGRKMREFFVTGNGWTLKRLQQQFDSAAAPPQGAPHASDPLAPIAHERIVELPRSEVWRLLSTSEGWQEFLGVTATIELRTGGRFEVYFGADAPAGERGSEGCTVLSFVPNEMLSFTWNAPPKFSQARPRHTSVVILLDELAPTRTRVRLHHRGFAEHAAENPAHQAEWQQVRAYFQSAWGNVLDALKQRGRKLDATAAG